MKKFVAGSMLAAVAFAGSGVYAHEGEPSEVKSEIKAVAKVETEIKKEEKKAEKTEKREEQRKENVQKFWNNMKKRLGMLIRNQERLATRIETKIAKMKAEGKNVTAAEAQLVEARKLIVQSKEALAKGDTAVANILAQNDAKTSLVKVKAVNKEILDKIKASQKALVKVLELMAGRTPTPTPSGSTSPTPTPTPTATSS